MPTTQSNKFLHHLVVYPWIAVGAFLAALALEIFLMPSRLIDGGIVGIAMILARLFGESNLSFYILLLTIPFIYLAFRFIRRTFVIHMMAAVLLFAASLYVLHDAPKFSGDPLEVIVMGGAILGIGVGIVIRYGACIDGTEILAILINRRYGFTVGQVVLVINIFVFAAYGLIFKDWNIAIRSLLTYIVAFKMIDLVIVGLDEMKSVMIISAHYDKIAELIMNELGLGLTIIHGKGGFSGERKEILFVIVERLDLADLKDTVLGYDPNAFMAIENLHEVVYGKHPYSSVSKRRQRKLFNKH